MTNFSKRSPSKGKWQKVSRLCFNCEKIEKLIDSFPFDFMVITIDSLNFKTFFGIQVISQAHFF